MNYVVPGEGPSVVIARHLLPSGMPLQAPEDLMHELNACGVRRLVIGHTPHGSCASVIKSGGGEGSACLEVIMGDTSYSDPSADDMRGTVPAQQLQAYASHTRVCTELCSLLLAPSWPHVPLLPMVAAL